MQDVDCPGEIQALPQPTGARRPRVKAEAPLLVLRPQSLDRIGGHRGWRRDLGEGPAVRPPEPEGTVGLSLHVVALLVDRAVVPATEHGEVRQRRGAPVRPMADVMPLAER